jgi:chemotaxis protein methyltransferase CheR
MGGMRIAAALLVLDPAFAALKARVIARTGHHYYADKDDQLAERVGERMAALGIGDVATYVERLDDGATGPREWERIESAVTINETFFFRFEEQFQALRETILPGLIAARGERRQLRIWSVGCSTGAEPYSIAILLHRLLGARLADWRVAILGTDIDAEALATARAGLFGRWALRSMAAAERAVLFVAEGERFRLKPEYRAMVRFERQNMMALLEGAAPLELDGFDLILCRNVLIYFRADMATALVGALADRLRPDGALLVGHAEPNPGFDAVATPVDAGGVLAYRRLGTVTPAATATPPAIVPPVAVAPRPVAAVPPKPVMRPRPVPVVAAAAPDAVADADAVAVVRGLLSEGAVAGALDAAQAALAVRPQDAVLHYLAAIGAEAADDRDGAEAGYRRAVYLENGFAMAHYLLGRLYLARGRAADGRRALANAARVVAALPTDAPLAEGEGMTAGDLVAAVRHALAAAA